MNNKNLKGRKVLIGVCGGIAAYKICGLVSTLTQVGVGVRVVMTREATRLIGPLSFRALSGHPVLSDREGELADNGMEHIEWARWAELLLVAPCTAHMLSVLAAGSATDSLSTLSLAFSGPQLIVPAMNPTMWAKAAVQRNAAQLREDGYILLGPEKGATACGEVGVGRMAEEKDLIDAIARYLP